MSYDPVRAEEKLKLAAEKTRAFALASAEQIKKDRRKILLVFYASSHRLRWPRRVRKNQREWYRKNAERIRAKWRAKYHNDVTFRMNRESRRRWRRANEPGFRLTENLRRRRSRERARQKKAGA